MASFVHTNSTVKMFPKTLSQCILELQNYWMQTPLIPNAIRSIVAQLDVINHVYGSNIKFYGAENSDGTLMFTSNEEIYLPLMRKVLIEKI